MPQLCSSYMAATLSIFRCLEIQKSKGDLYSKVTPSGKIIPKSTRNRAKIQQKSKQNHPKVPQEHPKSSQERPACPKTPPRATKIAPRATQERPKSAQKRPKSITRAPKSVQERPKNHPTAPYVEDYIQTNISSQNLISVCCFVLYRWNLPLGKIIEKPLFFLGFVDVLLELSRSLEMQKISTNKRKIT